MDDADLAAALALDELIPATLAHWRPLLSAGVLFFLERLPPARLAAILAEQLTLPEDAPPAARAVALLAQCPTLHKLGQVVARDRRLPPELRTRLQTLESLPPTTPLADVLAAIRAELPAAAPVTLAEAALAEASVAVVLPFTWEEGGTTRHGVFKVLKPGIEQRLAEELAIWRDLGVFLEQEVQRLGLPDVGYRGILDSVRELLAGEVRLDREQAHLRAAAALYAADKQVVIPRPLPWCTPRLTAMERIFGVKLTDTTLPAAERRRLADTAIAALLGQPFWSDADYAVIHADPHAGNLLATDDGRLAVLDWSLIARLSKTQRETVVQALLGALTLDVGRICRALAALGRLKAHDPLLVKTVEQALNRVTQGELPGFDWLVTLLDKLAFSTDAGFRDELVLFRKAWLTLAGVLADLSDADSAAADRVLLTQGLYRFVSELPARPLVPVVTREFATHVSNADLWLLGVTAGLVPARYWLRRWQVAWREIMHYSA